MDAAPQITDDEFRDYIASLDGQIVYFAQVQPRGPIKIGLSTHDTIERRINALQVGCPYPLIVTRIVPGGRSFEQHVHRLFRRLRMRGEWFYPAPVLARVAFAEAYTG